jgi:iron-sulfur cluster insertion protein
MVTVTPKATQTIKAILTEEKKDEPIRIFFAGFSCSGPAYMMGFDKKKDNDVEQKVDGFTLIYEKELEDELKEAVIDSVDTPQGPGVIVKVKSSGAPSCGGSCAGCH